MIEQITAYLNSFYKRAHMKNRDYTESDFYLCAKMLGICKIKPDRFLYDGLTIYVDALIDEKTQAALGGRNRAYKLLRHATLLRAIANNDPSGYVAQFMRPSFDAVSQKYPILRTYFEEAMAGGYHLTAVYCR